ncbi:MAG: hypothetical protein WCE94_15030 [Candidatus Methanoperedens sp.]
MSKITAFSIVSYQPEDMIKISNSNDFLYGHFFNLIKEVHIRLVGNTSPMHCLFRILGFDELPSLIKTVPLKDYHDLVGVICIAEEATPFGTVCFAGRAVLIEHRLPLVIVLDFMSDK